MAPYQPLDKHELYYFNLAESALLRKEAQARIDKAQDNVEAAELQEAFDVEFGEDKLEPPDTEYVEFR